VPSTKELATVAASGKKTAAATRDHGGEESPSRATNSEQSWSDFVALGLFGGGTLGVSLLTFFLEGIHWSRTGRDTGLSSLALALAFGTGLLALGAWVIGILHLVKLGLERTGTALATLLRPRLGE
jgi:hypothetical protein